MNLSAVVVERIVAGRDHDAAVEAVGLRDVGHRGRRGHVEQVGIGPRGSDARCEGIFEHIRRAARVLADDDARVVVHVRLAVLVEVPAEEAADFKGMFGGQSYVGFAAEAVGSKIFSHCY